VRERLWDFARGIGILLVVYGHVLRGMNSAGIVSNDHWIMVSDFAIYTFHMPLFFLLAGLNTGKGLVKDVFLRSKLTTIAYPYFLWSLVQGFVQVAMAGSTNNSFRLSDLATAILYKPFGQFWFLYALFLCHIFVVLTTINRLRVIVFALVAYAVGIYFDWGILSKTLSFFIFYAAGILLSTHLKTIVERFSDPLAIIICIIGTGIAIFFAKQFGHFDDPTALIAAFIGIFLILQLSAIVMRSNTIYIELLGLASMPIYLMHILAGSGIRIVLLKLNITNMYIHLGIGFSFGVLAPLTFYYLICLIKKELFFGFPKGSLAFKRARV